MKSLTLAVRTLREDSRAPVQWLLRSALVGTVLAMLMLDYASRFRVGAVGRDLFQSLVWINFWFLAVVGSALFSSVITEEKEQGTLGLLKLAGFGAPAILLGKSLGELSSAALLLVVQLPFAMLTVTLGGVSPHQVLAAFVQLAAFTFAVYGLALLSSVLCQRTASATRLTVLLVALLTFWTALVQLVLFVLAPSPAGPSRPEWLDDLEALSPVRALSSITATGFDAPLVTPAVLAGLGAGSLAILLAALWFPRATTRDIPVAPPRAPWSFLAGRSGRPDAGVRAVGWKEFHFAGLGHLGLRLRIALVAAVLVAAVWVTSIPVSGGRAMLFGEACAGALPWLLLIFVLDAGSLAGRMFQEEIRWHTLPALFSLPLPLRGWVGAKAWGAARLLVPSLAGLVLTVTVILQEHGRFSGELLSAIVYAASMVVFGLHLTVYLSLRLRRGAFAVALGSCIAGNVLLTSGMIAQVARSGPDGILCVLWLVAGVAIATSFAMQRTILRRLREHAAGPG